jgi:hypothetical protein
MNAPIHDAATGGSMTPPRWTKIAPPVSMQTVAVREMAPASTAVARVMASTDSQLGAGR